MKLQSTLPESAGVLHAAPLLDLLALLLVFLLMGPAFVAQSGVLVELPPSRFQIDRFAEPLVVTVTAGDPPAVFLGSARVDFEKLGRRLDALRSELPAAGGRVVVLRVDAVVPVTIERQVAELALQRGFRVILAGRASSGGIDPRPGDGTAATGDGS